jgi:hypothetical protein
MSSERTMTAARKIEPQAPETPRGQDTITAPPPPIGEGTRDVEPHDTIPTPPPESGIVDAVVIPPHRAPELDEGKD